jgi:hypothetical protein
LDQEFYEYNRGVQFFTTPDKDEEALSDATTSSSSYYHFVFNNCAQCADNALSKAANTPSFAHFVPNAFFSRLLVYSGGINITGFMKNVRSSGLTNSSFKWKFNPGLREGQMRIPMFE